MAKVKFDDLSIGELEEFIQSNGRAVDDIRAEMLAAHAVLERKEALNAKAVLTMRAPDFPAPQVLGNSTAQPKKEDTV